MSTTHPVMLAYEQTKNTAIPLILVVGREPNKGSGISVSCVEDIPFRKVIEIDEDGKKKKIHFSRCGLWNISFKIIADALNENSAHKKLFNTALIKNAFEKRHACPIIIIDASPMSIESKEKNKKVIRDAIPEKEYDLHLDRIFEQNNLLSRVKIVLFSGLDNFSYFRKHFEIKMKENHYSFPIVSLPFFYGTNSKGIKAGLSKHKEIITEIANAFINLPTN